MVHLFSVLAFASIAAAGFGIIAAMIGGNADAIRAALLGEVVQPRSAERRIRVRTRAASYRVMAQLPAARRAA